MNIKGGNFFKAPKLFQQFVILLSWVILIDCIQVINGQMVCIVECRILYMCKMTLIAKTLRHLDPNKAKFVAHFQQG